MLYKRILITGANGLLGQELVQLLSRFHEYDVLATARNAPPPATPRKAASGATTSSATPQCGRGSYGVAPLDVTSTREVRRTFEDFAPTVVVNCAAMTRVDQCETDRGACWKVNAEAVGALARQCFRSGAHLIQVSTDFVFNGLNGPYQENAQPDPVNFYGRSKQASENATHGAGFDRWSIVRTSLVYGMDRRPSRTNFVLWTIDRLLSETPLHAVTDQWRTPTYAPDLATGIERIIRYGKSGVYHLSGRDTVSVHEFAHLIADEFNLDATLIHPTNGSEFKQPAARPAQTGFIILKAETELGYKPRSIRQALRHLRDRLPLPGRHALTANTPRRDRHSGTSGRAGTRSKSHTRQGCGGPVAGRSANETRYPCTGKP